MDRRQLLRGAAAIAAASAAASAVPGILAAAIPAPIPPLSEAGGDWHVVYHAIDGSLMRGTYGSLMRGTYE
jgi:hypothetical protein